MATKPTPPLPTIPAAQTITGIKDADPELGNDGSKEPPDRVIAAQRQVLEQLISRKWTLMQQDLSFPQSQKCAEYYARLFNRHTDIKRQ